MLPKLCNSNVFKGYFHSEENRPGPQKVSWTLRILTDDVMPYQFKGNI